MTDSQDGRIKIVIDTNVLVPILTYKSPNDNWLVKSWKSYSVIPLICEETSEELRRKLIWASPTTKDYQAILFAERGLNDYAQWCETIRVEDEPANPQCRDKTDQIFIDLAYAGNAAYLVTRDGKLLAMDSQTPFRILTDADFRRIIAPLV